MILVLHPWPLTCLTPVTLLGSSYLVYGFRYACCTKIPKISTWEPDPYFQIPIGNLGVTKISSSMLKAYHLLENAILILCSLSQLAKPETWISEMRELPLPPPQHPTSSTYILHRSYSASSFQPEWPFQHKNLIMSAPHSNIRCLPSISRIKSKLSRPPFKTLYNFYPSVSYLLPCSLCSVIVLLLNNTNHLLSTYYMPGTGKQVICNVSFNPYTNVCIGYY